MAVSTHYSMSFTSATLAYRESITVAETYMQLGEWNGVRDKVNSENLLQMRTSNATRRICREVISRLKQLTPAQLEFVLHGTRPEQNYVLWLALCKRYRFIYDFAVEVLREKYLRLNPALTPEDYDAFFYRKAEWHPEVERVPDVTRNKQRRFLYHALRDAELISKDHHILPALLTPALAAAIKADDPAHFTIYPVSDLDIREWTK
jgi:hypothetical protein